MRPFTYVRARDAQSAVASAAELPLNREPPVRHPAQYIAGGTNMCDYLRLDVLRPQRLIDISHLDDPRSGGSNDRAKYGQIEASDRGLRLGALVRMSAAEDHPTIRADYPVIRDSLQLAASRQIRNMATLGGNPLQRTRCEYFRETSWPCNKRNPGSGCAALDGMNRQHAVLGTSDQCIATYAGDFAQALIALDATLNIIGPKGPRTIDFADLHRLPGTTPHLETILEPGELITFINVPAGPWTRRSRYLKIRDRQSYQFALASAAVALDMEDGNVREARIALGGVATVPWRAHAAEKLLKGKPLDERIAQEAAAEAFADAQTRAHNAFKVPLGRQTLVRALLEVREMKV